MVIIHHRRKANICTPTSWQCFISITHANLRYRAPTIDYFRQRLIVWSIKWRENCENPWNDLLKSKGESSNVLFNCPTDDWLKTKQLNQLFLWVWIPIQQETTTYTASICEQWCQGSLRRRCTYCRYWRLLCMLIFWVWKHSLCWGYVLYVDI